MPRAPLHYRVCKPSEPRAGHVLSRAVAVALVALSSLRCRVAVSPSRLDRCRDLAETRHIAHRRRRRRWPASRRDLARLDLSHLSPLLLALTSSLSTHRFGLRVLVVPESIFAWSFRDHHF